MKIIRSLILIALSLGSVNLLQAQTAKTTVGEENKAAKVDEVKPGTPILLSKAKATSPSSAKARAADKSNLLPLATPLPATEVAPPIVQTVMQPAYLRHQQ